MNLQDLQTMIDYHYWARDRLLDALESLTPEQYNRDLGSSFKSIRETVTHIYAAEWAWYQRWQGTSPTGNGGQKHPGSSKFPSGNCSTKSRDYPFVYGFSWPKSDWVTQ